MNCPVCKNELVILELRQIEVDYCLSCKGIWLDSGELLLLIEDIEETNKVLNNFKKVNSIGEDKYKCPRCNKKMDKILFSKNDSGNILIDKCKNNHGLWFDEEELIEVVKQIHTKGQKKIIDLINEMFYHNLNK